MKKMNLIDQFVSKESSKSKIIVIYGPTACGKTSLSLQVAKSLQTEIISTDSRQIYQGMNLGTWKILPEEMQGIPHHMIDFLSPDTPYSVWEYHESAKKVLSQLLENGKIPILVWGTGLYIDSLVYDFVIPAVPACETLRAELEAQAWEFWKDFVYQKLVNLDPEYAKELHPNNLNYVIRAIEVKMLSWKSKKDYRTEKTLLYDTLFLTPYDQDRAKLYEKIDARILQMFEAGLVEEVQELLEKYSPHSPWLLSIGYKEVNDYLEWKISLEACKALVQKHNRNYAKRQLTWFGRYQEYSHHSFESYL